MKIQLSLLFMLFLTTSLFAQSNKEEVDYMQSIFGIEKKAFYADFMSLEGEAKSAFWDLYDRYETERKVLGQNRIKLLEEYAENYDRLSDEKIGELINNTIKQKNALDKLMNKYYKKIKNASGVKAAGQFYQIESYVLSETRAVILESIPFIGELGT